MDNSYRRQRSANLLRRRVVRTLGWGRPIAPADGYGTRSSGTARRRRASSLTCLILRLERSSRGGCRGKPGERAADAGNGGGGGRSVAIAGLTGAERLAQGQPGQPGGGAAGRGRPRLPPERGGPAAGRTAVTDDRRAAQRPAAALVRRHAGRADPGAARGGQAHAAGRRPHRPDDGRHTDLVV